MLTFLTVILLAAAAWLLRETNKIFRSVHFYWNEKAGRVVLLASRHYENLFMYDIQDGTRSIGAPFRVSRHMMSWADPKLVASILRLVSKHPWFVKDPNLFVPFLSQKYYSFDEQRKAGMRDGSSDVQGFLRDELTKGRNPFERMLYRFVFNSASRGIAGAMTGSEPLYRALVYDQPEFAGCGLVRFRIEMPHTRVNDRFPTVYAGAHVGIKQYDHIYVRRHASRDAFTGTSTQELLPLTEKEAEALFSKGLAEKYIG